MRVNLCSTVPELCSLRTSWSVYLTRAACPEMLPFSFLIADWDLVQICTWHGRRDDQPKETKRPGSAFSSVPVQLGVYQLVGALRPLVYPSLRRTPLYSPSFGPASPRRAGSVNTDTGEMQFLRVFSPPAVRSVGSLRDWPFSQVSDHQLADDFGGRASCCGANSGLTSRNFLAVSSSQVSGGGDGCVAECLDPLHLNKVTIIMSEVSVE